MFSTRGLQISSESDRLKNLFLYHYSNGTFLLPGPNPMLFTTRCSYAFSRSLPTSAANPMFLIVPLDANMMMVYVVAAVAAISELCLFILTARSLSALALLAWLITWIHDCSYETTASHRGCQAIIVGPTTTRWEADRRFSQVNRMLPWSVPTL